MGGEDREEDKLRKDDTGRSWKPLNEEGYKRAAEIYGKLDADDEKERLFELQNPIVGQGVDENGHAYQIRKNANTGEETREQIPGLAASNEMRIGNERGVESIKRSDPRVENAIERTLIHAHVFSLNPEQAQRYKHGITQLRNKEITRDDFRKIENETIAVLKQANEEGFAPVDEIILAEQARQIASIEDTERRNSELERLILPLLQE